jgi:hypothetical protein
MSVLQLHSSHIELLLDNESLMVFLLELGLVSSLLLLSTTDGYSATLHCSGRFLSFYHFWRTISKSPPSRVPVLLFVCVVLDAIRGNALISVFLAARRVLTIRCLGMGYSALPRECGRIAAFRRHVTIS